MNNGVFYTMMHALGAGELTPIWGQQGVFVGTPAGGYGTSSNVVSSAMSYENYTLSGSQFMEVFSGGVAKNITAGGSNCTIVLHAGGFLSGGETAFNGLIRNNHPPYGGIVSGLTFAGRVFETGGSGSLTRDLTIVSGGNASVWGVGALVENLTIVSGTFTATNNGTLSSCTISSGGVLKVNGWITGSSAAAYDVTVSSCGSALVMSSGFVNFTNVLLSGNLEVSNGGTVNSTSLSRGGALRLYSGGTANATMMSGGFIFDFSSGIANSTTIRGGGTMIVYEGAVANNVTVHSNTYLIVHSGGSALNVTSMAGAIITSSAGAYITYA